MEHNISAMRILGVKLTLYGVDWYAEPRRTRIILNTTNSGPRTIIYWTHMGKKVNDPHDAVELQYLS